MMVNDQGLVGIGTTTPGRELEVNGGVRLNTAISQPFCSAAVRGTFGNAGRHGRERLGAGVRQGCYGLVCVANNLLIRREHENAGVRSKKSENITAEDAEERRG